MKRFIAFLLLLSVTLIQSAQFVFIDDIITWSGTGYDLPIQRGPTNWISPVNYVDGKVMVRYEVLEKPSTKNVQVQLCMWQDNNTPQMKESCGSCQTSTTPKVYYYDYGKPSAWWKRVPLDYTRRFGMIYLMHKDGSCGGKLMAEKSCGDYCYTGTDLWNHIPIKFKVLALVVSKGASFSPPAGWSSPFTVAPPTFDPPPGNYTERQYVTISSATTGADIHYELYGSEPDVDSRLYTQDVSVPINRTIKAVAYKHCTYSEVVTVTYTIGGTGVDEPVLPIRAAVTAHQTGQGARISVDAEDVGTYLTARVFTSRGREVAELRENHRNDKEAVFYWTGKDGQNRRVASGVYMVKLRSNSAAGLVKAIIVR